MRVIKIIATIAVVSAISLSTAFTAKAEDGAEHQDPLARILELITKMEGEDVENNAAMLLDIYTLLLTQPLAQEQSDAETEAPYERPPDNINPPINDFIPGGEEHPSWMPDNPYDPPVSVTGERFPGQGTLIDLVITGRRYFYTIETQEGTILYLLIDYDKEQGNVYLLTGVSDFTIETVGGSASAPAATTRPPQTNTEQPHYEGEQEPSHTEEPPGEAQNYTIFIVAGVLFAVVLAFGYFKKIKGKKSKGSNPGDLDGKEDDYDDYDDEEEWGDDEDAQLEEIEDEKPIQDEEDEIDEEEQHDISKNLNITPPKDTQKDEPDEAEETEDFIDDEDIIE